ncbi:VOC family protein [Chachezhania sediminis]|uniref:hypothetical protein n=1 Tax=Chachezhania sediminis TaxID=2599291 RepID=UPI0018EED96B|nr:hypothetical protein [Chachezhania sediminis]
MNGLVFGTFVKPALEVEMNRPAGPTPGAFTLAHNVALAKDADAVIERLPLHGRQALRRADAPLCGGYRGYVPDPDGHAWEIAGNPA